MLEGSLRVNIGRCVNCSGKGRLDGCVKDRTKLTPESSRILGVDSDCISCDRSISVISFKLKKQGSTILWAEIETLSIGTSSISATEDVKSDSASGGSDSSDFLVD